MNSIFTLAVQLTVMVHNAGAELATRAREERGEGVISSALAVLIMAGIAALAWVAFKTIFQNAENAANNEIGKIGQ